MYPSTKNRRDLYFRYLLKFNGFFCSLGVGLIFIFLARESIAVLWEKDIRLFFSGPWYPTQGQFNLLPMIIASFLLTGAAVSLAIPLGLLTAICECFYLRGVAKKIFRKMIELYTGIPSVIFGFWGLMKVVPLLNEIHVPGHSLLAGILILSLMVFPILSLNLISAIEMTSQKYTAVSETLSLSKSTFIWKILLPNIRKHIWTGSLLALGRAIGETMAVLMVCGNIVQIPASVFDPVRSLTANIALEMSYAMGEHRAALFLSGLILMLLVSCLFIVSEKIKEGRSWKD